jgi:putative transposase
MLLTAESADGASSLMKHLGQRYVQTFNRKHRRTGTLWDGRFRSFPIDSERYLITCQRYIELNPVRAGMVRHPRDYRWSSYSTNAEGMPSTLLTPHFTYRALAGSDQERLASYRALFGTALSDAELKAIRESVNSGIALGSKAFVAELEKRLNRRIARGKAGRPRKKPAPGAAFL